MGDLGTGPRLVVPEGLVIDEGVRERLERRLAWAPAAVCGIGAESTDLPSGSSYRVYAEWRSLEPEASAEAPTTRAVRGAALVRANVDFEVRDGVVDVGAGALLVDPGAHVHDPHRPIGPLAVATERGRPPFPRRPVVLFLACERTGLTDWARRLVNRLVRHDVEARIALPDVGDGLHLTRPCLPAAESVRALAPDVVVTLDGAASACVDEWCAGDRSTVVIGFDEDVSASAELVSWQIGHAAGRLRARIGPRADAWNVALLVNRLCSGPHPIPPGTTAPPARPAVRERWTSAAGSRADCVVITGSLSGPAVARVDGLVDNLGAASFRVAQAPLARGVLSEAREAAVVVLAGVTPSPALDDLLAERRRGGLPTVVDLAGDALDHASSARGSGPLLTGPAAALASACGSVTTPIGAVRVAAESLGVRSLLLPTLMTRARAAALRAVRASFDAPSPVVIGWHVGTAGDRRPEYLGIIAEHVAKTVSGRSGATVELVGDASRVPIPRRGKRVTVVAAPDLDAAAIARWALHIWTPDVISGEIADDPYLFEEASCAGVPSILPALARDVLDGFISPHVLVQPLDSSDDSARALRHLVGNAERRATRAEEARRRADSVDGPAASRSVANRFFGWARHQANRREVRT